MELRIRHALVPRSKHTRAYRMRYTEDADLHTPSFFVRCTFLDDAAQFSREKRLLLLFDFLKFFFRPLNPCARITLKFRIFCHEWRAEQALLHIGIGDHVPEVLQ